MELSSWQDALRRGFRTRVDGLLFHILFMPDKHRRVRSARVLLQRQCGPIWFQLLASTCITLTFMQTKSRIFSISCDNVTATPLLLEDLTTPGYENITVVFPRCRRCGRARPSDKNCLMTQNLAIIDQTSPFALTSSNHHLIGDVAGKKCVLVRMTWCDLLGGTCVPPQSTKKSRCWK